MAGDVVTRPYSVHDREVLGGGVGRGAGRQPLQLGELALRNKQREHRSEGSRMGGACPGMEVLAQWSAQDGTSSDGRRRRGGWAAPGGSLACTPLPSPPPSLQNATYELSQNNPPGIGHSAASQDRVPGARSRLAAGGAALAALALALAALAFAAALGALGAFCFRAWLSEARHCRFRGGFSPTTDLPGARHGQHC